MIICDSELQCKASRSENPRHIEIDRRGASEDLGTPLRGTQRSNVLDSANNQRLFLKALKIRHKPHLIG